MVDLERVETLVTELRRGIGDWRTTVLNLQPSLEGDRLVLAGDVLDAELRSLVEQKLSSTLSGVAIVNRLAPLVHGPQYCWAIVARPIVNLRRQPGNSSELLSQTTLGEAVEVLRREGHWCFVRVRDGYLGWVEGSMLLPLPQEQALAYRASATHLVAQGIVPCYDEAGRQVALVPFGTPVVVEQIAAGTAQVNAPNGQVWCLAADQLISIAERPQANPEGFVRLFDILARFVGTPYLWGGSTPFGFDCSGLVQAAYQFAGVALPRDADMQALVGTPVDPEDVRPGDLLFFTSQQHDSVEAFRRQQVTHVALALERDRIIHANQRYWSITINSLSEGRPDTFEGLRSLIVAVRRHSIEER